MASFFVMHTKILEEEEEEEEKPFAPVRNRFWPALRLRRSQFRRSLFRKVAIPKGRYSESRYTESRYTERSQFVCFRTWPNAG